jgi:hypothetical protein
MTVTELRIIALQIDADARLAAAAGGAARYLADNAGLEDPGPSQLQAAVIAACNEAFNCLNQDHPHLNVILSRHSDRIEVELSREAEAGAGEGKGQTVGHDEDSKLSGIDRIQHETRGRLAITRLTKFISQGIPSR